AGVDGVDRMQLERERRDDTKIAAAAAQRPKQIRIFVGIGFHEFAVRQDYISGEQIIDAQPALAGQMTDSSAQSQSADSSGGNNSARRRESKRVRSMIDVAPH